MTLCNHNVFMKLPLFSVPVSFLGSGFVHVHFFFHYRNIIIQELLYRGIKTIAITNEKKNRVTLYFNLQYYIFIIQSEKYN